jgi:hypothetical protein
LALTTEHTLAHFTHFTQWVRIWRGWLAAEGGDGQDSIAQLGEALSAVQVTGARLTPSTLRAAAFSARCGSPMAIRS